MSRIGTYVEAYKKIGLNELRKRVWSEMNDDGVFTWASALAYSWMFALFPLVIFLLTLIAFLPINTDRTVAEVQQLITSSLPAEAAKILTDQVPEIIKNQRGGLLTIGAALTLWAASGGMATTMSALNRCYDITEDQPFYIARPKAILLTLVVLVLTLIVLALLPIGGLVIAWMKSHSGTYLSTPVEIAINVARYALSLAVLFFMVALIYYFGPRLKEGFRFVTPGGTFAVVVWLLLGLAFKYYITNFGQSYGKTYGAVGGAVILLLFLYLSSVVLLIGAELNSEFDFAMYGRTGGMAVKPGERPGSATPEAEAAAPPAPKAGQANSGPGAETSHISGPIMGPKMAHPPEPSIVPPLPPKQGSGPWALIGAAGLTGAALGWLLKPKPLIFHPKLTPKRRLRKVYPVTYAALKNHAL